MQGHILWHRFVVLILLLLYFAVMFWQVFHIRSFASIISMALYLCRLWERLFF
jgi:hypothetical protein